MKFKESYQMEVHWKLQVTDGSSAKGEGKTVNSDQRTQKHKTEAISYKIKVKKFVFLVVC